MKKIFKYNYNRETGEVEMPRDAIILRLDHVDDGFYKGDFLWAIVDPKHSKIKRNIHSPFPYSRSETYQQENVRTIKLKVKEKQIVVIPGKPLQVEENDGEIILKFSLDLKNPPSEYKIAFFKTGQPIDIDLSKSQYLGLARIWIVQELGLYTFLYE